MGCASWVLLVIHVGEGGGGGGIFHQVPEVHFQNIFVQESTLSVVSLQEIFQS